MAAKKPFPFLKSKSSKSKVAQPGKDMADSDSDYAGSSTGFASVKKSSSSKASKKFGK